MWLVGSKKVIIINLWFFFFLVEKVRLCLVIVFVFYFQKLVFGNIKKKKFYCIFEIKNMFGKLKLKKQFFEKKKY